jgi:hypothetical protein
MRPIARCAFLISSRPEVWTWARAGTSYTRFVIEPTRRVQIVGSAHLRDVFIIQRGRTMTALHQGALAHCRVLICDEDRTWSAPVRHLLRNPPYAWRRRRSNHRRQRTRQAVRTIY